MACKAEARLALQDLQAICMPGQTAVCGELAYFCRSMQVLQFFTYMPFYMPFAILYVERRVKHAVCCAVS